MRLLKSALVALGCCAPLSFRPLDASAQASSSTGSLSGTVFVDTTDKRVANAEVSFPNLRLTVRTDSAGNYRILNLPRGPQELVVRAIGYEPVMATFTLGQETIGEADFMLKPIVTKLERVNITAPADPLYARQLMEFEARRKIGLGRYITSDVFEKSEGLNLSQLLPTKLPGIRIVRTRTAHVLAARRGGVDCFAQVILNGVSVYNGAEREPVFDINLLQTQSVIGMEYYTVASTPAQFNRTSAVGGGTHCGTVVIWTK